MTAPGGLNVDKIGEGEPLVFTHGYASSSGTWEHQASYFADSYEVVTWDLRGHGSSPPPSDPSRYCPALGLADLTAVLDGLGDRVPILIGHSLGGYLSLRFSLDHPVRGLVLLATGPGYRDPEGRQQWNDTVRRAYPDEARVGLVLQEDDVVMQRIREVSVPVLVMAGEKDRRFHASVEWFAGTLPTVETLIVPSAGHHVHEHQPAAVNAAIERFLGGLV